MAITRMTGQPAGGGYVSTITLWTDEPAARWPDEWTYFDMAVAGQHRMYYNADDPLFTFYTAYNEFSRRGGMEIRGKVTSPNGEVVAPDIKLDGLWSSRAGVFNYYVESGKGPADMVVDVLVHDNPKYATAIATSVKWLPLYSLLCKARSPIGEDLPVQKVTELHHGMLETMFEVVREFDYTFEVAAK